MKCEKCNIECEPTGSTDEYPCCNTWTCIKCGYVIPETGSFKMMSTQEKKLTYSIKTGVKVVKRVCNTCGGSGYKGKKKILVDVSKDYYPRYEERWIPATCRDCGGTGVRRWSSKAVFKPMDRSNCRVPAPKIK